MARKLRIQYPGAIYHVMNRGDRREAIFADDHDRELFLATLEEACQKTDWQVHAWCLMHNHFHLVIETPRANLVDGMKWFLGVYTSRFNRRHKEFGHLFSGRYKALIVDGSGHGYLKSVCDYVHLNPVRARLLATEQSLHAYRWSSYPFYLKSPPERPAWLRTDRLLGEWAIPQDSPLGREEFGRRIESRRLSEELPDYDPYQNGVGSQTSNKCGYDCAGRMQALATWTNCCLRFGRCTTACNSSSIQGVLWASGSSYWRSYCLQRCTCESAGPAGRILVLQFQLLNPSIGRLDLV